MSSVRSLRIKLGQVDVGSLFALDDGRVYFRVDDAYALNPNRPVLSVSFVADSEAQTQAQLLNPSLAPFIGAGSGALPVFFRNLLPEGMLRKHLLAAGGIREGEELDLLAYCGKDLPGDVWALPEQLDESALGRLITASRDSYEMSSHQLPTPDAISLSGVQPKVALFDDGEGRYVMRSKDAAGRHFIGKLPASSYPGLPEVEHVSLELARAAGVTTCVAEVAPLSAIADRLPFTLRDDAHDFLLVHRFDRDAVTPTGRLHMEDFAQAMEMPPDAKYDGTYGAMGLVLKYRSSSPQEDVLELLRRIKVNELLGNYDAHIKNFSLLYRADGTIRLSPAYDIVAYAAYLGGRGHALRFTPNQRATTLLTPGILRELANLWAMPETLLKDAIIKTVDRAMRTWPGIIEASRMSSAQKTKLLAHLEENPSVQAWRRRNKNRPVESV